MNPVCREHLEGHQAEMDFLSSQQRTTRRNSRLVRRRMRMVMKMLMRRRMIMLYFHLFPGLSL